MFVTKAQNEHNTGYPTFMLSYLFVRIIASNRMSDFVSLIRNKKDETRDITSGKLLLVRVFTKE